jgi:hypothetical protein
MTMGIAAIWTAAERSLYGCPQVGVFFMTRPQSSPPVVECPGCKIPMKLGVLEPSGIPGMSTGVYRCPICKTETARDYKTEP